MRIKRGEKYQKGKPGADENGERNEIRKRTITEKQKKKKMIRNMVHGERRE